MGAMEIVLIVAGGIILFLSFFIPVGKKADMEGVRKLAKEEIHELVRQEMISVKGHVDDVVEESLQEGVDKTERALERLTNEKIMAVNEYSDTVLDEINRNHKEVMFLYDMLNEKHQNIKKTVSEVNKTVKEAGEAVRGQMEVHQEEGSKDVEVMQELTEQMMPDELENDSEQSKNEKILALYRKGMGELDIAKRLGLGVGEVKLVIGLYRGNA